MDILAKNLLILASAGSGKTYQLANRIIGWVLRGAPPERIVALTFTRKAAGEFADTVLTKLATAAMDPAAAARLTGELGQPAGADFQAALARVVAAVPRLKFTTLDGYFAQVVRAFQYDLGITGGKFSLLEGPQAAAAADDLLAAIVEETLVGESGEEFYHAYRRATHGREDHRVMPTLQDVVRDWQRRYREQRDLAWGPPELATVVIDDWPKLKTTMAEAVRDHLDEIHFTNDRQRAKLEECLDTLLNHSIGSGSLSDAPALLDQIFQAVATTPDGPLIVKYQKSFEIAGAAAERLREWVLLAAHCEWAAALARTRAIREVVGHYDDLCQRQLREQGRLGFDDIKLLMGEWCRCEDARIRREWVDFRLDGQTDHWLLDEFQDTSRADWTGLVPLIDEATTRSDASVLVVGDRKQAIYAWRGGDVGLFDELLVRDYQPEALSQSWRSSPEVLGLVNQVCGDRATLESLFGEVAARWSYDVHESAPPLRMASRRGESRVERVGPWPQRLDRVVELLNELSIGKRGLTCGILLRGNKKVREVSDHLRMHQFDVIEEGRREPAVDNPIGIAIRHLLQWLANPADRFAWNVIEMSPFAKVLRARHGNSVEAIWEALTQAVARDGFAQMVEDLIETDWPQWSDFGQRRAGDLLSALAALDEQEVVSAKSAADWIQRLEVSQNPGAAAVQVMTIHKSKGLDFDIVILPEVPDERVPEAQRFAVASGPGWLSQVPPKWARAQIPALCEAEEIWAANQRYEAFCTLYVALTRAKRGLYVMLDVPAKSADPDKPSLANWLNQSIGGGNDLGVIYQNGSPDWIDELPDLESAPPQPPAPHATLGPACPQTKRLVPSKSKAARKPGADSTGGMNFGNEVHHLLEQITWVDELTPTLPASDAGRAVAALIEAAPVAPIFHRQGRSVALFREQPVAAMMDEKLLNGIIDRLHVHRSSEGIVQRVEIIDFKTDAVPKPDDLADLYRQQMDAYRHTLQKIYPNAEIRSWLVSVHHRCLVEA